MASLSKYLKDTEYTAFHVSVSVSLDTFQKYLPQPWCDTCPRQHFRLINSAVA